MRQEVAKEKSDNIESISQAWLSKLHFNHDPTVVINEVLWFVSKFMKVLDVPKSASTSKNLAEDDKSLSCFILFLFS